MRSRPITARWRRCRRRSMAERVVGDERLELPTSSVQEVVAVAS
jgi:hypothetical protein